MKFYSIAEKLNVIKDYLNNMDSVITPILSVLSAIEEEVYDITKDNVDLFRGLINPNATVGQPAIIFDPELVDFNSNSISVVIEPTHSPTDDVTISEGLGLEGQTLASVLGPNFAEACAARQTSTLRQRSLRDYDFGEDGVSTGTIVLYLNNDRYELASFTFNALTKTGQIIKKQASNVNTGLLKGETTIAALVEYKELLLLGIRSGFQNLTGTATDFGSAVSSYLNSKFSSVRQLARQLREAWYTNVFSFVQVILYKFSHQAEVTVNSDGSITWGAADVLAPETNPFVFAVTGVGTLISTMGTVLLFAAPFVLKVVGAVLTVLGTVGTAVMSAIGTAAGTVPTVVPDAPEPTYADYVDYGKVSNRSRLLVSSIDGYFNFNGTVGINNVLSEGAYQLLVENGQLAVSTAYWTIFIYNYVIDGYHESYEYKIFPNTLTRSYNDYNISLRDLPYGCKWKGYDPETYLYQSSWLTIHDDVMLSPTYYNINDASDRGPIRLDRLLYAFSHYTDQGLLDPSSLIVPSINYDDWNDSAGGITNSLNVICNIGGALGCFSSYDGQTPLVDGISWSGSSFSHVIPEAITRIRMSSIDTRLLFALLLCTKSVSRLPEGAPNFKYIASYLDNDSVRTVTVTITADLPLIEGNYYSPNFNGYAAMVTPPERSIIAMITAAAIVAVAITVTVITSRIIARRLARSRSLKHRAKIASFSEEMSHFDLTEEEIKQLSPEDRAEYFAAYRNLVRRIDRFNTLSLLFGNTTYDYRNDWVDVPSTSGMVIGSIGSLTDLIPINMTDPSDINNTIITGVLPHSPSEIDVDNLSLADIYGVIVGFDETSSSDDNPL